VNGVFCIFWLVKPKRTKYGFPFCFGKQKHIHWYILKQLFSLSPSQSINQSINQSFNQFVHVKTWDEIALHIKGSSMVCLLMNNLINDFIELIMKAADIYHLFRT